MSKITIHFELDPAKIIEQIERAHTLEDNQKVFKALTSIATPKKALKDLLAEIESLESQVKDAIKDTATRLYGQNVSAIKGDGYKIKFLPTGSVYSIVGEPEPEFTTVTTTVNSTAVNKYIKEQGSLPMGIELNNARGRSIRIEVDENDKD